MYGTIQDAVNAASGDTITIGANTTASPYAGFKVPGGNTNGLTSVTEPAEPKGVRVHAAGA